MFYKTIIQGRLTFNNEKSFDKVLKMYEYRTETYYKSDVLLEQEEIFDLEKRILKVKRFVGNASDKSFRNTVSLLEYCAQFAVSGQISAWMIEDGKVLNSKFIQPTSDKAVVMQFLKGDQLFQENEKNKEALEAFNKTIEKYDAHAQAYERRGWVNLRLKNYSDALYDFKKAVKLDDSIAFAYYGLAQIAHNEGDLEEAIKNYELTTKKSIALQALYWKARLRKAECHVEREEWDKAEFDLRFFTKRKFDKNNPNLRRKAFSHYLYAAVLYQQEKYDDALKHVTESFEHDKKDAKKFIPADAYLLKGKIHKALGKKKPSKEAINQAIDLGSKEAVEYLKEAF